MKFFSSALIIQFLTVSMALAGGQQTGIQVGDEDSVAQIATVNVSIYDTSSLFTEDWNNSITFSYANDGVNKDMSLNFIDSIHSYAFPIEKETTSRFGRRHGSFHKGIDIPLKTGEAIVAAFDGKVRYAKYNSGGFGNLVIIRHVNGLETYYAHLSRIKVKPNQVVKAGEVIGKGGSTGRSYSPHLHFEIRYRDNAINPEKIFDVEEFCLKNETALVGELMRPTTYRRKSVQLDEKFLAQGAVYSIKSGDTLSKIAQLNGTTVDKLCALNGLEKNSILQIGQRIRVN